MNCDWNSISVCEFWSTFVLKLTARSFCFVKNKFIFGTQDCAFPVSRILVDYVRCGSGVMFIDIASWALRLFLNIPLFIGKSFIFNDAGWFDPISWGSGEFKNRHTACELKYRNLSLRSHYNNNIFAHCFFFR